MERRTLSTLGSQLQGDPVQVAHWRKAALEQPHSWFGIVLSAKPISVVRNDAEDKFLWHLGISEKDAYKLKVSVRVLRVNRRER